MKIVGPPPETGGTRFRDLKMGDVFRDPCDDILYLVAYNPTGEKSALDLCIFRHDCLDDDAKVILYPNATLTLEPTNKV